MGGEIFVGIRTRDGKEHLMLRWTNSLPGVFASDSFLTGGEDLTAYIAKAKEAAPGVEPSFYGDPGGPMIARKAGPRSYGFVLVDFVDNVVFDSQGYATLGQLHVNAGNADDERIVAGLRQAGRLTHFLVRPKDPAANMFDDVEAADTGVIPERHCYAAFHMLPLRHQDDGEHGRLETYQHMMAFLDAHQWKSPRVTEEDMVREYGDDWKDE